jgi:isopentenyl diphosphate isomerase/L-lactate dehydrogenase-like FMN-dependent dehydrogenase
MTRTWPYNVEGFRQAAQRRLPKPVFDFVDGGAEDEETLRENHQQFHQLRFAPRLFVDVSEKDLSVTVAGRRLRLPIIFAPTGLIGMVHPGGETVSPIVASQQDILAVVSGHGTYSLEEVAERVPGSSQWFDMFPWKDRGFFKEMIDRTRAAGYTGLAITVDTTVGSNRERDWANGWTAPPRLLGNVIEYGRHPVWVSNAFRYRRGTLRNFNPQPPSPWTFIRRASTSAARSMSFISPKMSWDDMEWIRSYWNGPLAIKGAFNTEDAVRLADLGVEVLLVGNHGGRQLDGLQTGLEQLVTLRDIVGDRMDLVLDGGIRRGSDIIKALCLGARACMIGRAWVYALGAGGQPAVEAMLGVLEREMNMTMALLGVASVSDLDGSYLRLAGLREADLHAKAPSRMDA